MAFKMKGSAFYGKYPFKNKNGGYHKGQVNDAETEEMNDNIATGKGPAKPKGITEARPKPVEKGPNPDSDENVKTVPLTTSNYINQVKTDRKDPDHKKANKINNKLFKK
jgi:hypothetical protein